MINYKCTNCGEEFTSENELARCKKCESEDIEYSIDSSVEFVCKECRISFDIPLIECEGYWNWKCPECNKIAQSTKNISFKMPSGQVKIEKIGEYTKWKPAIGYLSKEYGLDASRPYTDYVKKKKK